jgi:hypothetical protein
MNDDPNSIADALDRRVDYLTDHGRSWPYPPESADTLRSAARLLREQADTADRLAEAEQELKEDVGVIRLLRRQRDAAEARLALWQSNTEGAIADAGDLPGDLTTWSAIRRLTAERDELRDP